MAASPTRPKAWRRLSMFFSRGAMAPILSCPNISDRRDTCSSFGFWASASRTLKIAPWASVCMSLASCVASKPIALNASAWLLLMAVPRTSAPVKFFRAVAAISGPAPADRKAAPRAATCVSPRPQVMATAPTRWMTSPSAGAVAFMLLERWLTASARE